MQPLVIWREALADIDRAVLLRSLGGRFPLAPCEHGRRAERGRPALRDRRQPSPSILRIRLCRLVSRIVR